MGDTTQATFKLVDGLFAFWPFILRNCCIFKFFKGIWYYYSLLLLSKVEKYKFIGYIIFLLLNLNYQTEAVCDD